MKTYTGAVTEQRVTALDSPLLVSENVPGERADCNAAGCTRSVRLSSKYVATGYNVLFTKALHSMIKLFLSRDVVMFLHYFDGTTALM
jgi:hypothetical protein